MEFGELLKQAGISQDDLKDFIAPIIKEAIGEELKGEIQNTVKEAIGEELKGEIQNTVREQVGPVIEALPGQVNTFVTQQVEKLAGEVKAKADERLDNIAESGDHSGGKQESKAKDEISPELKEKLLNKFLDKALGSDEEGLTKLVEKLAKQEQVKATLLQNLGIYQPGPEIIWKAYQDATAKAYASMMKGGKMPFPVVDDTTKKKEAVSQSSPQRKSGHNSSKRSAAPGVFDRFLR
ncbi:hypothetical protein ES705_18127 [subsurface metagenome]